MPRLSFFYLFFNLFFIFFFISFFTKSNFSHRLGKSPPTPLRENGNVTVTLTLNSQAADDIMGVLKDLANILNIAPPTGYQIVERTTTPPSQKLGLYRTKGKDGKEGGK